MKTQRGISLIESMVGLAILSLLSIYAVPGFQDSIQRSKVRTTSSLVSEMISTAQSEALRRNIKVYLTVIPDNICIGTVPDGCDLRKEPLETGVSLVAPKLILSPFYGVPSIAPANYTVSYNGVSQTVSVNQLGVISIGPLS